MKVGKTQSCHRAKRQKPTFCCFSWTIASNRPLEGKLMVWFSSATLRNFVAKAFGCWQSGIFCKTMHHGSSLCFKASFRDAAAYQKTPISSYHAFLSMLTQARIWTWLRGYWWEGRNQIFSNVVAKLVISAVNVEHLGQSLALRKRLLIGGICSSWLLVTFEDLKTFCCSISVEGDCCFAQNADRSSNAHAFRHS